jgi:hypothetical protein
MKSNNRICRENPRRSLQRENTSEKGDNQIRSYQEERKERTETITTKRNENNDRSYISTNHRRSKTMILYRKRKRRMSAVISLVTLVA